MDSTAIDGVSTREKDHDGNALADMVSPPREAVAICYAVEGGAVQDAGALLDAEGRRISHGVSVNGGDATVVVRRAVGA